jgi:putative MATE family efflux protein
VDQRAATLAAGTRTDSASAPSRKETALATSRLLEGPVLPALLKLATPTVILMTVQAMLSLLEIYFVGVLGTDAVAGVTLVFPVQMMMISMASGGIGGGVSAAVARAMGAGNRDLAATLALHAVCLALAFGLAFSVINWLWAPALFGALGGTGTVLGAALSYANVIFCGAVFFWTLSLLSAALRGSGNARVPAMISVGVALVTTPLSPLLIAGWEPMPGLGVAGAALAIVMHNAIASALLVWYMRSHHCALKLPLALHAVERRFFAAILRVGGLSLIGTVQANLTVIFVTGLVGYFGAHALAGYGIASRLDYVLMPLVFGIGAAVLTMVGMNVGAGNPARARQVAWYGALLAGVVSEAIGLAVALFPHAWLGLFSSAPAVIEHGTLYLQAVGPVFGFYGIALTAYFAGQGAGRVTLPILAGTLRLCVAAVGGWCVVTMLHGGAGALFWMVSAGYAVSGMLAVVFLLRRF